MAAALVLPEAATPICQCGSTRGPEYRESVSREPHGEEFYEGYLECTDCGARDAA